MTFVQTPAPRIIFNVFANEKLEETENKLYNQDIENYDSEVSLNEFINYKDYKHAFFLMQIRSFNEDLAEEGVGEWIINTVSDWACQNMNKFHKGLNAIYDEDKRYTSSFVFSLLNSLLEDKNQFRVSQTIHTETEESFIEWSNENLIDEQDNPVSAS